MELHSIAFTARRCRRTVLAPMPIDAPSSGASGPSVKHSLPLLARLDWRSFLLVTSALLFCSWGMPQDLQRPAMKAPDLPLSLNEDAATGSIADLPACFRAYHVFEKDDRHYLREAYLCTESDRDRPTLKWTKTYSVPESFEIADALSIDSEFRTKSHLSSP